MKIIVTPVNFSAGSNNAARYAADMAQAIHADLYLANFVEFPVSTAELPVDDYVLREMQNSGEQGLKQLREELIKRTDGKVNILTKVEIGAVEYRLEEFCLKNKPFVVVMGTAGTPIERVFAASKTTTALRHLPYPLIVIPENAVFQTIEKILLACDLDDIAGGIPVTSPFLKEFRELFNARLEVINVTVNRQDKQKEAEAAFKFNSWKDRLQEMYPEIHFVQLDKVEEGIGEYLDSHPADLLLVFPKKHGFFEFHKSHAKKIAFSSLVPVMSIHD